MPELSNDKVMAACYPPESLYDDWCDHANRLDLSVSHFLIKMVEAGRKNIDMGDVPSESIRTLRQERDELQREVERQRERTRDLERQLERTAQTDIVAFVEDHPGVATPEIIQQIANTVPGRVASHLDALEGEVLVSRDDGYYPLEHDTAEATELGGEV
jgi:multidrug resistance efflux pump